MLGLYHLLNQSWRERRASLDSTDRTRIRRRLHQVAGHGHEIQEALVSRLQFISVLDHIPS